MNVNKSLKKIYIILIAIILVVIAIVAILLINNSTSRVVITNDKEEKVMNTSALTMMYETEAGSGEYQVSGDDVWGKEGYIFNEELSKCENGSKIYYDSIQNKVFVETNTVDRCYVYFDKYGYYLNKKILEDNPTVLTRTNFDMVFTEENFGTIYTVSENVKQLSSKKI